MVRLFKFPSFEEWCKKDRKFKETIGEFTCVFHPTCWYLNSSITRYECAIATCDNPTNIYVTPVVSWGFECDSTDTALVEKRYHEACREIHSRWIAYIENNYNSDGMLCPEMISMRSILIAAFCASNKREMSIEEVNKLLSVINDKAYDGDQYNIYVDVPSEVDIKYLEQLVGRDYSCFRITRQYDGIRIASEANPSQLYFKYEIKSSAVLDIIRDFYNPESSCGF